MEIITPYDLFQKQVRSWGRGVVLGKCKLPYPDPFLICQQPSFGHTPSFFLDSVQAGPQAQYSYLSLDEPRLVVGAKNNRLWVESKGKTNVRTIKDPLQELAKYLEEQKTDPLPGLPFLGGAVGYMGYDCARHLEKLPSKAKDDLGLPDFVFGFYDRILAFDHKTQEAFLTQWLETPDKRAYDRAASDLGQIARRLEGLGAKKQSGFPVAGRKARIQPSMEQKKFEAMVKKAKDYIAQGDIYQANLSQRFEGVTQKSSKTHYDRLRRVNPSPYACLLDFKDFSLVSSSPELLLRVRGQEAETRPIAGTRPRGETSWEDQHLGSELLLDPKERAEHLMLLDLERNDLGRVCDYGSVSVAEFMVLERYSHVIHIVSHVKGRLNNKASAFSALQALFPGGTVTGCPKVRCMEIIEELEPLRRGPYTGSAGWIGYDGSMDMNILIRTIVLKAGKAYVQVGAGIVADSDPAREYAETLHKAQAMFEALGVDVKDKVRA